MSWAQLSTVEEDSIYVVFRLSRDKGAEVLGKSQKSSRKLTRMDSQEHKR
jgi:hypothetical protein